jgi:hypothetical protein
MGNVIDWKETEEGCLVCSSHKPSVRGYPRYGVRGKSYRMHRYIYEQLFGEIPEGMMVMHLCDNRMCINPEHLRLGTYYDNMKDMYDKKRNVFGEKCAAAKLTGESVAFIKKNKKVIKGRDLAKMFGVSPQTICDIHNKRGWKHVAC